MHINQHQKEKTNGIDEVVQYAIFVMFLLSMLHMYVNTICLTGTSTSHQLLPKVCSPKHYCDDPTCKTENNKRCIYLGSCDTSASRKQEQQQ